MSAHTAFRRCALAHGYEPLAVAGKVPVERDWQKGPITTDRLDASEAAHPTATNTGLRTGRLVAVDIDLTNAAHVAEIEKTIAKGLGETQMRRVGKKGALLCYRNETPVPKITIGTKDKRLVEILGAGQQFVADGLHPDTGQPYEWTNDWLGAEPSQFPFGELPGATPDQLYQTANAVAAQLSAFGYGEVSVTGIKTREASAPSPASGVPVTAVMVADMLRAIPPSCDRGKWLTVCGALVNAPVSDATWDGLDVFAQWSSGAMHDGPPANFQGVDDCQAQWDRDVQRRADIPPFGALVNLAREHGYKGPSQCPRAVPPARDRIPTEVLDRLIADSEPAREGLAGNPAREGLLPSYMGSEIGKITPPSWLISRMIPIPGVGIIFGKFGSYKTTILLDLADSVLTGKKAFGQFDAEQGDVVIVAGEGLSGLKDRIEARARKHGLTLDQYRLLLVAKVPKVDCPEEWAALAETIRARGLKPKLIGIDHLSIMLAGQDQNDATVATQAMQLVHELSELFQCTVIILGHAGKDGERELRGSSAFLDNVDFAYELSRADG